MRTVQKASSYIPKNPTHIECHIEKNLDVVGRNMGLPPSSASCAAGLFALGDLSAVSPA